MRKEAFDKLEKNSIKVTEYSDNMIKGTLNTDQDGLAICCVTYDKGWTIYVDGKKIDYYFNKRLDASMHGTGDVYASWYNDNDFEFDCICSYYY